MLYADQHTETKRPNEFALWTHCKNDHCVFVVFLSGWCPALCVVWPMWGVRKGAREKVQLQLHRSSPPATIWGLWPSHGTCSVLIVLSCYCWHLMLKPIFYNVLLLSSGVLFCAVEKSRQSDVICFVFACRSFALDMTMETEAFAVMWTSCRLSKGVSSCPSSSCLGMHCAYNIS